MRLEDLDARALVDAIREDESLDQAKFDSIDKVAEIGSPLLVVHGTADPLIPARLGQQLFDAAREPKRLILVEGASHHNTQSKALAQYRQALHELFGLSPR